MNKSGKIRVVILGEFPLQGLPLAPLRAATAGGTCTWLLSLAKEWKDQADLEIHWGVLSKETAVPCQEQCWGQTFHILPTRGSLRMRGFYHQDRKALSQLIQQWRPDVVHGWGSEDIYGWSALSSGRPHLVSVQGILRRYVRQPAIFHPKVYVLAFMEKYLFQKAQLLTVETPWGEEQIRRWAPQANIQVLEYGIQRHFFDISWKPEKPSAAIFVGTLDPNKGVEDLVEAFRSPKLQNHELWVVGTGGRFADRLRSRATRNVRWFGRLSSEETAARMARATCLALPTRNDTSPNVIKEARVLGLPVLTTTCGGQRSYLVDGEDGYVLQPGNIPGTLEKLCLLLQEPDLAEKLGARGRDRYRELFRPEKTANAFLSIYRQLSAQTRT